MRGGLEAEFLATNFIQFYLDLDWGFSDFPVFSIDFKAKSQSHDTHLGASICCGEAAAGSSFGQSPRLSIPWWLTGPSCRPGCFNLPLNFNYFYTSIIYWIYVLYIMLKYYTCFLNNIYFLQLVSFILDGMEWPAQRQCSSCLVERPLYMAACGNLTFRWKPIVEQCFVGQRSNGKRLFCKRERLWRTGDAFFWLLSWWFLDVSGSLVDKQWKV